MSDATDTAAAADTTMADATNPAEAATNAGTAAKARLQHWISSTQNTAPWILIDRVLLFIIP